MLWFFLVIWLVYWLVLISIIRAWAGIKSSGQKTVELSVSVIVPFRNEAQHLETLVKALGQQAYPYFEVVFVNDHSTDASEQLLAEILKGVDFDYHLLNLSGTTGKKAAISQGVGAAKGEIILTTDADCVFAKHWIERMAGAFADSAAQMVSGPVNLVGTSFFQKWQQMEFSVLIATGAAGISWQKPSMANGANLAYRKSVFQAVAGFDGVDAIASGDDELLMMKVHKAYPGSIRFVKECDAVVTTEALGSWAEFRNQRLRWAGKWRYGKRKASVIGALSVFGFNLLIISLPVLALAGLLDWGQVLAFFLSRLLIELALVLVLNRFFNNKLSVSALILHQILYPFYAIYFGMAANFGNYQWKGRSYKVLAQ
ncbi:MAG: glycosyltransferase [Roseivirga sp.]